MSAGNYYVYITTNPGKTLLYTGVTNDLRRRLSEHYKHRGDNKNFAGKYYCYKLVYYEYCMDINQAISRGKEINDMSKKKKKELIATANPHWQFLFI